MNIIKNTTKTITPDKLVEQRDNLTKEIKDYWFKTISQNIIRKGEKPKFDSKEMYRIVRAKEAQLIKTKMYIQAINMGLKSFSEMKEDNIYQQIFLLSQLKEHLIRLKRVPTRKNSDETVILTEKFIKRQISEVESDINKIQNMIADYNKKTEFKIN